MMPSSLPISLSEAKSLTTDRTLLGQGNLETLYRACQAAADMPGDIAEIGTWKGGATKLLAKCLPEKTVWAFDTFAGLPALQAIDEAGVHHEGDFNEVVFEDVSNYLLDCPNVVLAKGLFPEETGAVIAPGKQFALVHLDVDLHHATLASLRFFWKRMVPGGLILVHDYDWPYTPGIAPAIQTFLKGAKSVHSYLIEIPDNITHAALVRGA